MRFAIGETVTWCEVRENGRSITYTTKQGTVVAVRGGEVITKMRGGKIARHLSKNLRYINQPSELTEAVSKMSEKWKAAETTNRSTQ